MYSGGLFILVLLALQEELKMLVTFGHKEFIRQTVEINMSILTRGGHWGLWYCSIELFFMQYFSILNLNMRYCGII